MVTANTVSTQLINLRGRFHHHMVLFFTFSFSKQARCNIDDLVASNPKFLPLVCDELIMRFTNVNPIELHAVGFFL